MVLALVHFQNYWLLIAAAIWSILFYVQKSHFTNWFNVVRACCIIPITDYGHPERKKSLLQGQKFNPKILRYGQSIFFLPHRPNFSDIFDLCLHWVYVVCDSNGVAENSLFETQHNLHIKNSFDHFSDELAQTVQIWHVYFVKYIVMWNHIPITNWFNLVGAWCIIFIRPNKYFKTDVTYFQMGFVRKLAQFIYGICTL